MTDLTRTERTRVKRMHERGRYSFEDVANILDAGFLCHVGYVIDGQPFVTPTSYWREGDRVYWHGSSASRMLRTQGQGVDVCFTVSHVDGFVLARAAFHHSINYRAVMLLGKAQKVEDEAAKLQSLEKFVERLFPGRWKELRPANKQEVKATTVLSMRIEEGSAKLRTGPPKDDEEDYTWPVWAGVVPVHTVSKPVVQDERQTADVALPAYLADLSHLGIKRE